MRTVRATRKWLLLGLSLAVIGSGAGLISSAASAVSSPPFLITPRSLVFGYVPLGSTSPDQEITITNVSGVSQVMNGAGGAAGVFGGVQDCQGQTLAAGASCHMFYAFTPTAKGAVKGSTNGTWNGETFSLTFAGTGTPQLLITPTFLAFGRVKVGTTSPEQAITITNLSNNPQVMNGAGGAAGVFGGVQNCEGETVAPGASCQMFYAFSPTAAGAVDGSTNGTWNGQPFSIKFAGTGTT